jgi:hypothetical protein
MKFIGVKEMAREIITRHYNVEELEQRLRALYMNGFSEALRDIQDDCIDKEHDIQYNKVS